MKAAASSNSLLPGLAPGRRPNPCPAFRHFPEEKSRRTPAFQDDARTEKPLRSLAWLELRQSSGAWISRATWLLAFHCLTAFAEPPTLEHVFPVGAARGSTNVITITGKFEPWPVKVWTSGPGLVLNAETNKGKFRLEVAADAPAGPRFLRLYNDDGASEPRFLVIAEQAELLEAEPNDHFARPQRVEQLPATINGKLDKIGDVDSFAVTLRRGQTLQARLEAYTLASKMDALLRLVTTNGLQLAWNHDFVTLDPQLTWAAPEDDLFVVQVMGFKFPADAEVRLTGGDGCVYRLHLEKKDAAPAPTAKIELEIEPNSHLTNAQPAALPISVRGSISPAGDEDRFVFEANKDDYIDASVAAAALGSPLDAWLRIEETGGKELARSDDANGSSDPQVEWKAPASGKFVVVVGSLAWNPGLTAFYQLSVRRVLPDFKAALGATAYRLTAGSTNDLKISVNRLRGFDHKLSVITRGLPDGVMCDAVDVPEKGGEIILKLRTVDTAKPSSQAFQLVVRDPCCEAERVIPAELTGSSTDNGVPGGYADLLVDSIDQLWLTVLPKPAEQKKEAEKK